MIKWVILAIMGLLFSAAPLITMGEEPANPPQKSLPQQYRDQKAEIKQAEKEQKSFDVENRVKLAIWALETKDTYLTEMAQQDLREIIKHSPDEPTARALLGYIKYQDRWVTQEEFIRIKEGETEKLLHQWKNGKEEERAEAVKLLKEIEPFGKIRPLVKVLRDTSADLQLVAVKELQDCREKAVVPYLVRTSLDAKTDTVREAAVSAVKTLDVPNSINWYDYYLKAYGNASDGLIRGRVIQGLSGLDSRDATPVLLWAMYYAQLEINAQSVTPVRPLPDMRRVTVDIGSLLVAVPPSVSYELPDVNYIAIATTVKIPVGGGLALDDPLTLNIPVSGGNGVKSKGISLKEQVALAGQALEKTTGQKFGTDYVKWCTWYRENSKDQNKTAK